MFEKFTDLKGLKIHKNYLKENLGCPLGNHTPNSGCPEPFSGCPGRPDTQFVKPCYWW